MRTYDDQPGAVHAHPHADGKRVREPFVLELQHLAGNRAVVGLLQRTAEAGAQANAGPPAGSGVESVIAMPEAATGGADSEDFQAISDPTPVSWAAVPSVADDGFQALAGPTVKSLTDIQSGGSSVNPGRFGLTTLPFPTAQAPQFTFNTVASTPGGMGPPSYASTPKWKQHFDEGDNTCWYAPAGTLKSLAVEGGLPVYYKVSAAISALDMEAEREHADDLKRARDISIKEAETVLATHIIGKRFPSRGTAAEAEQLVLDEITAKLTHKALGNDQTLWSDKYRTVGMKSAIRDGKQWHTFGVQDRKASPTKVTYTVNVGSTSIGVTPSSALIVY